MKVLKTINKQVLAMKTEIKIDGKSILNFLKYRLVRLEKSDNKIIFEIQLLWFLIAMIFLSGFIIVALIISLFLGCKISMVDTSSNYIGEDKPK
ncbi:MAG: hypothetical protein V5786_11000 [Psychromonas sp.]